MDRPDEGSHPRGPVAPGVNRLAILHAETQDWTEAEHAISNAMVAVEHHPGGSIHLTNATSLLAQARQAVAQHVIAQEKQMSVEMVDTGRRIPGIPVAFNELNEQMRLFAIEFEAFTGTSIEPEFALTTGSGEMLPDAIRKTARTLERAREILAALRD